MAFGYAEAAGALGADRLLICNILMQKSTSLPLLGSDGAGLLKSLPPPLQPLSEVKLKAPLSLGPSSGCSQKAPK